MLDCADSVIQNWVCPVSEQLSQPGLLFWCSQGKLASSPVLVLSRQACQLFCFGALRASSLQGRPVLICWTGEVQDIELFPSVAANRNRPNSPIFMTSRKLKTEWRSFLGSTLGKCFTLHSLDFELWEQDGMSQSWNYRIVKSSVHKASHSSRACRWGHRCSSKTSTSRVSSVCPWPSNTLTLFG